VVRETTIDEGEINRTVPFIFIYVEVIEPTWFRERLRKEFAEAVQIHSYRQGHGLRPLTGRADGG
jgi:hypothetical protein